MYWSQRTLLCFCGLGPEEGRVSSPRIMTLLILVLVLGLSPAVTRSAETLDEFLKEVDDFSMDLQSGETSHGGNETNCFGLVEGSAWPKMLKFEPETARVRLNMSQSGNVVLKCLKDQLTEPIVYKLDLLKSDKSGVQSKMSSQQVIPSKLLNSSNSVDFQYLIHQGSYQARFILCLVSNNKSSMLLCKKDNGVITGPKMAEVSQSLVLDQCASNPENGTISSLWSTYWSNQDFVLNFNLSFEACTHGLVLPYERIKLYILKSDDYHATCHPDWSQVLVQESLTLDNGLRSVSMQSPSLSGHHFYCLFASQEDHVLCQNSSKSNNSSVRPHICSMPSRWVWVEAEPLIAKYIPYCSSHLKCAWIYVTITLSLILILSCLLATCIVYCCCTRRNKKTKRRPGDTINFEGLCLTESGLPVPAPKKTWLELHNEWDSDDPRRDPGKILLLYSPDSEVFKELQKSFKAFLQEGCHCIVLDLFDEDLLQMIAYNPESYLEELLRDDEFKIIVVCSKGAYKRQEAHLKGEVLNLPNNSTMDGLFSAGLRFIQKHHSYDYNRLALARYEMLHLTAPEYRLEEMVPNREFLIPTQLHDLFCWIHGYDPLDLLGKPWERYHLEWQLMTDALKKARKENR